MLVNNSSLNNYNQSNSLNTELNDSLKNLQTELNSNKFKDESSSFVLSENISLHVNMISANIKEANSGITVIQRAEIALSEQSNILNLVNSKLMEVKNGLPNIDSAFVVVKEIQQLMADLESIANENDLLQSSSSDRSKHMNLIFQLSSLVNTPIETEDLKPANLDSDGLVGGELSDLKADQNGSNRFLELIDTANSFDKRNDIENSWNSKKAIDGYIADKSIYVDAAIDELTKMRELLNNIQKSLEASIKQMTENSKRDLEGSNLSSVDYAQESIAFDKSNILSYAGSFKLSQANLVTKKSMNLL